VEAKINIENVEMLLVLRQAARYRGRKRIEAVCETTVPGAVALRCGQGKVLGSITTALLYGRWLVQGMNSFISFYLIPSYPYLFSSFILTRLWPGRSRNSNSSPGKGKIFFSLLKC
jgi:hypothetical protein